MRIPARRNITYEEHGNTPVWPLVGRKPSGNSHDITSVAASSLAPGNPTYAKKVEIRYENPNGTPGVLNRTPVIEYINLAHHEDANEKMKERFL